jgi:hypothetical protein
MKTRINLILQQISQIIIFITNLMKFQKKNFWKTNFKNENKTKSMFIHIIQI